MQASIFRTQYGAAATYDNEIPCGGLDEWHAQVFERAGIDDLPVLAIVGAA